MAVSNLIGTSATYGPYRRLKEGVRTTLHFYTGCDVPIHREENVTPFFIVGSGRAGTTLLRRILQASDQIHIPPEIWAFKKTYRCFRRYRSVLQWDDLVSMITRGYIVESDFDEDFHREGLHIIQDLVDFPEEERSLAKIIDTINRYHGNYKGSTFSRWGDKTPLNSFCLKEILEVFPDAKFVHLIRDPADVIRSYLKYDNVAPESTDLKSASERWERAVLSVKNIDQEKVTEVYYENFVVDAKATVRSVCSFLGIRFHPSWLDRKDHDDEIDEIAGREAHSNVFDSISTEHIGKGRRELDTETLRRLDGLIGEECENLGYEPLV